VVCSSSSWCRNSLRRPKCRSFERSRRHSQGEAGRTSRFQPGRHRLASMPFLLPWDLRRPGATWTPRADDTQVSGDSIARRGFVSRIATDLRSKFSARTTRNGEPDLMRVRTFPKPSSALRGEPVLPRLLNTFRYVGRTAPTRCLGCAAASVARSSFEFPRLAPRPRNFSDRMPGRSFKNG
jgi:hypothetical protein